MSELPKFIANYRKPRLIPIGSDSSREGRITSIFLSILPEVPALAGALLETVSQKISTRTKIRTYSEVEFNSKQHKECRPDGLIELKNVKGWTALVEVKVNRVEANPKRESELIVQIEKYGTAAKDLKIDSLITISNDFAGRPDHPPVTFKKRALSNNVSHFHWSWAFIRTQCQILLYQDRIDDKEQKFLIAEFVRYMDDAGSGVERFTMMNPSWPEVIKSLGQGTNLKPTSPEVVETVAAWFQEERDLSLHLASEIGESVEIKMDRKHRAAPEQRIKDAAQVLVDEAKLNTSLTILNAASEIEIEVDLRTKEVRTSMRLSASDKPTLKGRVGWLLGMLKIDARSVVESELCGEQDLKNLMENLEVKAHWPGRNGPTTATLQELEEDFEAINRHGAKTLPHSFDVILHGSNAKRFNGRRTFIEDVERQTALFYLGIGHKLRQFQPRAKTPNAKKLKRIDEEYALDEADE